MHFAIFNDNDTLGSLVNFLQKAVPQVSLVTGVNFVVFVSLVALIASVSFVIYITLLIFVAQLFQVEFDTSRRFNRFWHFCRSFARADLIIIF